MVLDRFEGEIAVCEDMETRELLELQKETLPEDVSPGDVLVCDGFEIIIDHEETEARCERIRKMFEDLSEG